jgi:hypothetical protein
MDVLDLEIAQPAFLLRHEGSENVVTGPGKAILVCAFATAATACVA